MKRWMPFICFFLLVVTVTVCARISYDQHNYYKEKDLLNIVQKIVKKDSNPIISCELIRLYDGYAYLAFKEADCNISVDYNSEYDYHKSSYKNEYTIRIFTSRNHLFKDKMNCSHEIAAEWLIDYYKLPIGPAFSEQQKRSLKYKTDLLQNKEQEQFLKTLD